MNKAKDVFRTLLRSPSQEVRRAAAEGLAFLSTLGVREDARFLQSAVLHDLDAVIRGTNDQEQGKQLSVESICAGRSAAVLALSCMQRTAYKIQQERRTRAQERGSVDRGNEDTEEILPLFQILIKILPSITIRPTGGFLGVRAVGMHAFGLMFSYSSKINIEDLSPQEKHLLKKLIELVEDNFLSAWTAASTEFDHGTDEDKLTTEVSFVAVLLRLMTFLTPKLSHLHGVDDEVALRFARMSALAIECFGSHPTVRLEAMAFHEILSQHQHLLPAHAGGVKYDEHAVLRCIPILMESISHRESLLHVNLDSSSPTTGMASRKSLRAAVKVVRFLSVSNVLVAEWSGMEIIALLFAALEESIGSQTFAGNTFHRSLSAPRDSEILYRATDSTAREISQVMRLLVLLERRDSSDCLPVLLRYILLSRCILTGKTGASDNNQEFDDQRFTVATVVQAAIDRGYEDACPILEYASTPRWQVKVLAIQVMTMALSETAQKVLSEGKGLRESIVFSPKLANIQCTTACREAQGSSPPPSVLSLHIGALVTVACGMATATVDQVELRCLQESAIYLIRQIVDCFGDIPDPDQQEFKVLNDDIPQLSAAIKNALTGPEDDAGANTCRLFFSGCLALQSFLKMQVTSDKGVLKRIFRPIVPENLTMFGKEDPLAMSVITSSTGVNEPYSDIRANLLIHIARLLTIGSIPASENELLALIEVKKAVIGAHAASLAIDGARLVLHEGLTLGGAENRSDFGTSQIVPCFLTNWNDINDSVKAALVSSWPKLASLAVSHLIDALDSSDELEKVEGWLQELVPMLFAGLGDAISARFGGEAPRVVSGFRKSINTTDVATACLTGITALSASPRALALSTEWKSLTEGSLSMITKAIFEPVLSGKSQLDAAGDEIALIEASCTLILRLTNNPAFNTKEDTLLLNTVLQPLCFLESKEMDMSSRSSSAIVSTCLTAVAKTCSGRSVPSGLVKALINVVLKISERNDAFSDVQSANRKLLMACLSADTMTIKEESEIAQKLAASKDWEGWCGMVKATGGAGVAASISIIQEHLLTCVCVDEHLPLLKSLQLLLQSSPIPGDMVGRIISSMIAEVMVVFHAYATLTISADLRVHRSVVCADSMKFILTAIQQMSKDGSPEDDVADFLHILFQVMTASIRYNGLPNSPVPIPGCSDPALGRMCAQAITHIARVVSIPFKSSMVLLQENDRVVLEFAVRAEMSGYASAPTTETTTKKKLSLKGFKK